MDVSKAAMFTLNCIKCDDFPSLQDNAGKEVTHAVWMLSGITMNYIKREKAHRWLGYAQALLVVHGKIDLDDAKECNRRAK